MPTLNCEADELLYRAAFSSENKAYIVIKDGKRKDLGYERYCKIKKKKVNITKTWIVKQAKERGHVLGIDYELECYIIPKPVEVCLGRLKTFINTIAQHGDVRLFLTSSDKSNFRFGIVETKGPKGMGYKAGRPPRPIHYEAAREYLLKNGAEEVFGYEADDALCMHQTKDTIAVHIDKDINMVVGKHLNWVEMKFYDVPEGLGTVTLNDKGKAIGRGLKYFYHQLLTGDATDNILGIKGIGDKTAFVALEDCTTEKECLERVMHAYIHKYGRQGYLDILYEMADLLWMVRKDKLTGRQYLKERFNEYTTL